MFETAKWITRHPLLKWSFINDPEQLPPSPYLARTFTVGEGLSRATLHIVGLGQAAYWVNGSRLPDSYRPTHPSNPTVTVIYTTYDLTALLHPGANRLGAALGNLLYNDPYVKRWRSTTKLLCELLLEYENGKTETIVTDTSWKTADSPTLFGLRRCGEKYDARLEIPGWCDADFDDSGWDAAHICMGPGGRLRATECPPVRVMRELPGREIAPGLFDFGENTSGWVRLTVSGKRGAELSVRYAEKLTSDGAHVDQSNMIANTYAPMAHRDVYILKGEKTETFEQLFAYHGFQYAEIEGDWDTLAVTACTAHTDLRPTASFSCDNDMLNAIHALCVRSVLTNCHGMPVDCPHREQNEWTGDGMLSAEVISSEFDAYGMWYNWMQLFQDDQYPDGSLPCIIPAKDEAWEHNFANGPDWDSAVFHIPYYAYKYTGDRRIVDLMWENMQRSLNYFASRSMNGLLCFGVGDWCSSGPTCGKEITDTAYYRLAARMMAEMAAATGRDAAPFEMLADRIKADFRAKYVQNGRMTDTHQTALAAAIFTGMLDGKEVENAAAELAEALRSAKNALQCGVHGIRMLFDALSDNGQAQAVMDMLMNADAPGYAHVVRQGYTTLPEGFDYGASLNHHFRSPVDTFLYKQLAGIRIEGFGFEHVVIQPRFVAGVSSLTATMCGVTVSYTPAALTVRSPYPFTLVLDGARTAYPAGEYTVSRG